MNIKTKVATFLGTLLLFPLVASADFSFEGYLAYTNGTPVSGSTIISLKVLSPGSEACILYSEDHTVMLPSDGYAALSMGSGTRTDGLAHTLAKAFENSGTFTGLTCVSGTTYTPAAGEKRKLKVVVNVTGTPETLGLIDINPVPTALSAGNVRGFAPSQLLRGEIGGVPANVSAFTPTQVLELGNLANGTSSFYMRNNFSQGASLPNISGTPTTPITGSIWYDTTSNQVKYYNGSISQTLSVGGGAGGTVLSVTSSNSDIFISNPTSSPVLTLNTGTGVNQIVKLDGAAKLPSVDASQVTNLSASNITSGILPVTKGGTGLSSLPPNALLATNGASVIQSLPCSVGQILSFDGVGPICMNAATNFLQLGGNAIGAPAVLGTNDSNPLKLKTAGIDRVVLLPTGDVGVGTATPAARLQVQGQIVASEAIIPSGAIVNFMNGNSAVLQSPGGSVITLNGLVPGGRYTVVIEDTTARTYTFSGCVNKFSPANTVTTTSTRTIYEIYHSGSGGTCYIHMIPGYQ